MGSCLGEEGEKSDVGSFLKKKIYFWWYMPLITALGRGRVIAEFKSRLVYRVKFPDSQYCTEKSYLKISK